jgi:ribonuclease HI
MRLRLRTDGASRGNPGPAGAGMVLEPPDGGPALAEWGEYLGTTTNNVAEYRALIGGLRRALELGATAVDAVSDSELMVRQVSGQYQVRSPQLAALLAEVRALGGRFPDGFRIRHTRRGQNARADALANEAIDRALSGPAHRRGPQDGGQPAVPTAAAAASRPHQSPCIDIRTLAAGLPPGEGHDLGAGMVLARLAGHEERPGLRWVLVLEGSAEIEGATTLATWGCGAPRGGRVRAGEAGAVLLAVRARAGRAAKS